MTDEKKRISTREVLRHPWFKGTLNHEALLTKEDEEPRRDFDNLSAPKREAIVLFFQKLGFHRDYVLQSLSKNLFNHVKACYQSLARLLNY